MQELGLSSAPDPIMPKLLKQRRYPSAEQLATIRKDSEFYAPNRRTIPLVEILPTDLEKKVSPYGYKIKDFVKIDPKDLLYATAYPYYVLNGQYYRKFARIDPKIIKRFDLVHEEVSKIVNPPPARRKRGQKPTPAPKPKKTKLTTDEGYRPYGENIQTYWEKLRKDTDPSIKIEDLRAPRNPKRYAIKFRSRHVRGQAVDIKKNFIVNPGKITMDAGIVQEAGLKVWKWLETGGIGIDGATTLHIDESESSRIWSYATSAPAPTRTRRSRTHSPRTRRRRNTR
ncbi:MAG: hypothetical protein WC651_00025 [Candidatus Gracilibacteria bacterium]|jgi:hypothetical protein